MKTLIQAATKFGPLGWYQRLGFEGRDLFWSGVTVLVIMLLGILVPSK